MRGMRWGGSEVDEEMLPPRNGTSSKAACHLQRSHGGNVQWSILLELHSEKHAV